MKSPHSPAFRFSIMVLALSSGFAHADNVRPEATAELKEVVVTGRYCRTDPRYPQPA